MYDGGGSGRWPGKLTSSQINLQWPSTSSVPRTVQSWGRRWGSSRFPKPSNLGMRLEYGSRAHNLPCEASDMAWSDFCPVLKKWLYCLKTEGRLMSWSGSALWNNFTLNVFTLTLKYGANQTATLYRYLTPASRRRNWPSFSLAVRI